MGFREKIIIFGVLPWLLAILMLIWLILPGISSTKDKFVEQNEKKVELENLEQSIEAKKDTTKIQKEITSLQEELVGFNKEFPVDDDLEAFYVDFQTAMNTTNLYLEKIAVSKEKAVKLPSTLFEDTDNSKDKKKKKKKTRKASAPVVIYQRSFKVDMIGDYQSIIDLVNYLNSYYRFITLENISIKENKKALFGFSAPLNLDFSKLLSTSLIFSVYKYEELKIDEEADKKSTKKTSKESKEDDKEESKE